MGAKKKDKAAEKRNKAAVHIQCLVRKFMARVKCRRVASRTWLRSFDPRYEMYFFFNKNTGKSEWSVPKYMTMYTEADKAAGLAIGKIVRGFLGRTRARKEVYSQYTRYFDFDVKRFYWIKHATGTTFWKATPWLIRQEVPMPAEDQQLLKSYLRIQELESQLAAKDDEIKQIRKATYEELEPQVLEDRVKKASDLERSTHMDEWTIDELAAWFIELKIDHVIPFLYQNRVDGNLFVNLEDEDWSDMGIVSKFHQRKLQIIMKAYRTRYERKKARLIGDDDLMSEYAPSELSDKIANEDNDEDSEYDEEEEEEEEVIREEIVEIGMSEEEKQQEAIDKQNIQIEIVYEGNGMDYPIIGDIVRVAFTCRLIHNDKIVSSTRNAMGFRYIEVVLGVGMLCKGFDRALPKMSVGERSKISLTASYGYPLGLPPHIPPDCELMFEVTLAGFRPRPIWAKPLLQEPGLSEKPYIEEGEKIEFDDEEFL